MGIALDMVVANHFESDELHFIRPGLNNFYFLFGDYAGAMKISTDGLTKAERLGDKNRVAHFSNVIGYIHMKQKNFAESEKYFSAYLHITKEIKDSLLEAHALYNLADLSLGRFRYDSAIQYLTQSIRMYRSIKGYILQHSFTLFERESYVANKLAEAWKLKGDYMKALQYIKMSIQAVGLITSVNNFDKADYLVNAGDIYNRLQMPDSAIGFLRKGLSIAKKIIHREHTRNAYEQLALAFSQKKMYDSAWFFNRLFSKLRDSIENENDQREIYQREAILQVERQQQKYEITLERQRTSRNIIIGLAVFLLAILYLLYNRYRLQQKNKFQAELNRQQQEILNNTINVQDQERKRIAEDLHDGLGSILSAAKLKLSSAVEDNKEDGSEDERLKDSLALIDVQRSCGSIVRKHLA